MGNASQVNLRNVTPINDTWAIKFITFNYTCLLDRLVAGISERGNVTVKHNNSTYGRTYSTPLHIHGTLDDDHGIIIGVDNNAQIIGASCQSNSSICNMFVKPEQNRRTEDMRPERAIKLIEEADVICVYGMSFGETDATWWKQLGSWVANPNAPRRRLVLATLMPSLPSYMSYALPDARDNVKRLFIERSGLEGSEDKLRHGGDEKVLVTLGTHAFDLFEATSAN